jgi:hypothetical protein
MELSSKTTAMLSLFCTFFHQSFVPGEQHNLPNREFPGNGLERFVCLQQAQTDREEESKKSILCSVFIPLLK